MASSARGGGGELLSLALLLWWGGVGEAAIMNNVQIVPGPVSVLLRQVFLDWMPNHHRTMKLKLPHSSLMNILLISLTCRYTTTHKFRFGDLMSNHKLGWQTSDQQNKTVSCEGGFYSSVVFQETGWGYSQLFLIHCSLKKWREIRSPSWNSQRRKKIRWRLNNINIRHKPRMWKAVS